jgi:phage terminase small subunit
MTPEQPVPPKHLSKPTQDFWKRTVDEFDLEEHHLRLLTLACESWDRGAMARQAIAKLGLTFNDRFGQPHARPEVAIERDSRIAFARLMRELSLDVVEPEDSRPPVVVGKSALRVAD